MKIQHEKSKTKIQHEKYNMKIKHGNKKHPFLQHTYNTHTLMQQRQ